MFPQITLAKYAIGVAVLVALIGGFYWHAYSKGEQHAVEQQQRHDLSAQQKADDIRQRIRAFDPDKLLENDPFLRR